MRILVDSKIASTVPPGITRHAVRTAVEEGCAGLGLEALVQAAVERGFDALLSIANEHRPPLLHIPPTLRVGLVPDQDPADIAANLSAHLEMLATAPAGPPGRPMTFRTVRTFFPATEEEPADESIPECDSVPESQEEQLRLGIARLLSSKREFVSLMVFTSDGQGGFFVSRRGPQVAFHETVDARRQRQLEAAIRGFHETRGHAVITDYLASNGGIPNSTRVMAFEVPGEAEQLLAICLAALREVRGVSADDPLHVDFKSHPGNR